MEGPNVEFDSSDDENHKGYYRGRILRIKQASNLYCEVQKCFAKHAIVIFLFWFHNDLQIYLNEPKTSLPGK